MRPIEDVPPDVRSFFSFFQLRTIAPRFRTGFLFYDQ
jgi:hypothetical protein